MRIKIIKKVLLDYLDLIMLKGTLPTGKSGYINEKTLLTAVNDTLIAENLDETGAVYSKCILKRVEVLNPGQFPIEDLVEFVKIIKNFNGKNLSIEFDKINIRITDGVKTTEFKVAANISDLKTIDYQMLEKVNDVYKINEKIANELNLDNSELLTTVDITSDELKSVTSDGDLSNNRVFPIEFKDGKLNINITNDFDNTDVKYMNSFDIDIFNGLNAKTIVSYGFDNIFKNIVGQVTLYLNDNSPLVIENNTKDINFLALLVPLKGEEDIEDITDEEMDDFFD